MNSDNKRIILIASAVIIVGSALMIYQMSKSKSNDRYTTTSASVTTTTTTSNAPLNDNDDIKENTDNDKSDVIFPISSFIRMRGLTKEEIEKKSKQMDWIEKQLNFKDNTLTFVVQSSVRRGIPTSFSNFRKSFDNKMTNVHVFKNSIEPLIKDKIIESKSHVCVFNYGQKGSGQSHTLLGSSSSDDDQQGLYYLTADTLFKEINNKNTSFKMEYFEIRYNNITKNVSTTIDLLSKDLVCCNIRQDKNGSVHIRASPSPVAEEVGLTQLYPENSAQVLEYINDANQRMSVSLVNEPKTSLKSDLAHKFLKFELVNKEEEEDGNSNGGSIMFVLLAASNEYLNEIKKLKFRKKDQSTISQKAVNKSVENLKQCVFELRDESDNNNNNNNNFKKDVSFGKDKLTMVLRELMVEDGSCAIIIANISPNRDDIKKNINTLRYAEMLSLALDE